jgi:alkanesulfonate monooxygenase SsuD/methylene tetrahydromethanopterin reductase-like flavin-dependent oxidoreductase (luciferase family)
MTPIRFGLFEWLDRGVVPLQRLYEQRLELLEVADEAGFFCYHLAEHHGTTLGMAPSPALFLSAVAQRTRRIRLGPLVYLLPLYDPLRLVEEVCMLDHLSAGRLELGVGRGVSPYELGCFGVDVAESRAIFDEALAVLVAGLTRRRLTFAGKHYRYQDVPIELQPLQQPYPPLWYPTHNPQSIEYAARNGFNFVGLGPADLLAGQIEAYWRTWEAHRHEAGRLNGHVAEPKVGALRQVFVADRDDEARTIARSAYEDWYRSITSLWHAHDDHTYDEIFSWDNATRLETIVLGSPARVSEQIARLIEVSGCNYVIGSFAWGSLPHDQALRSLRLFVDEVMPALDPGRRQGGSLG